MLVIGAAGDDGRIWSTVLTGPTGFVEPVDDRTIEIASLPVAGDPLREAFARPREIGLLALQPQSRRRIRASGRAHRRGDGLILVTDQVLGNCPKYIQTRDVIGEVDRIAVPPGAPQHGAELTAEHQKMIAQADTFFIASHAPGHGGDASHRGGQPGFVRVLGPRRLSWPDYFGNSFYMTLGNLQLNPACGLLFLDWENGDTVQLTGHAKINWDAAMAAEVPGALRMVEFEVETVVSIPGGSPLRWALLEYSRFNPPSGLDGGPAAS
jgi:predicted pyridoxine 5'-phosphate oxidase superfamily flavin-nucleotide-binding protein